MKDLITPGIHSVNDYNYTYYFNIKCSISKFDFEEK